MKQFRTRVLLAGLVSTAAVSVCGQQVASAGSSPAAPDESKKQVTALAPQDIRWFIPAYYTDGRQRAHLLGDSSTGGERGSRHRSGQRPGHISDEQS